MKNSILKLLILPFFMALIFAGCELPSTMTEDLDEVTNNDSPSEVQVRMQVQAGQTSAKSTSLADSANSGIVLNEVKLFIEEMELESVQSDSLDLEVENFIVNLPLDGSPLVLSEVVIPAGLYSEFELEIEKPDDEDMYVEDPEFRDETGSYSIVVNGTYNGANFTFRSSEDFEIELELNPLLEITESGSSLLVVGVDLSSWFKDEGGTDLDPNSFENIDLINENIEASFEGFEEEFEEGGDDEEEDDQDDEEDDEDDEDEDEDDDYDDDDDGDDD